MPELARDDRNIDTLGAELRGVGVAEAVSVNALLDSGFEGEPLEHHADVRCRH